MKYELTEKQLNKCMERLGIPQLPDFALECTHRGCIYLTFDSMIAGVYTDTEVTELAEAYVIGTCSMPGHPVDVESVTIDEDKVTVIYRDTYI